MQRVTDPWAEKQKVRDPKDELWVVLWLQMDWVALVWRPGGPAGRRAVVRAVPVQIRIMAQRRAVRRKPAPLEDCMRRHQQDDRKVTTSLIRQQWRALVHRKETSSARFRSATVWVLFENGHSLLPNITFLIENFVQKCSTLHCNALRCTAYPRKRNHFLIFSSPSVFLVLCILYYFFLVFLSIYLTLLSPYH